MPSLKTLLLGSALSMLTPSASAQGYQCPLMMPDELTALEFAYGLQNWLYQFYSSMGSYSADDFAGFPNADMTQSNGETLAANLATNMAGLTTQAQLGVEALTQLAGGMDLSSQCQFTYPPGLDDSPMAFFMSAYYAEATLCGTFIGLADYVQNPAAAFLMARLSAEHGIHGSYLGSYVNPTPYSADSMALTPAFTPEHVLMPGDGTATRPNVGYLGEWIPQGCLPVPSAPCDVNVEIGNLTASLSGAGVGMGGMAGPSSAEMLPTYSTISGTVVYTGIAGSYTELSPYPPLTTVPISTSVAEPSQTANGYGGYGANGSYPAGTEAGTSYGGPMVTAVGAAAPGAEVSGSMMAGLCGVLLAAFF